MFMIYSASDLPSICLRHTTIKLIIQVGYNHQFRV